MIELVDIKKSYGANIVFNGLNINFDENKITAVLGASGCGKTTLLNIICGITDFSGKVNGADGKVSYMFQEHRLLPNLTVKKNLEYVLKNMEKTNRDRKIESILSKVETWEERDKYPHELSGGMAQRVALARAFVFDAPLLIMDEPFKGLDISLKKRVIDVFMKLYSEYKRTAVFVTHDIDEALLLSDRIIVLKKGYGVIDDIVPDMPISERKIGALGDLKARIYGII